MSLKPRSFSPTKENPMFEDWELIHRYTRADALRDGTLIDVSETAREAGIRFPTALTRAVWAQFVRVPEAVEAQDESGRLWDLLWMLRAQIGKSNDSDTMMFRLYVRNDNCIPRLITLKAVVGPGDDSSSVITIMLPDED
jgi:Family of unknown function (DUF6573)